MMFGRKTTTIGTILMTAVFLVPLLFGVQSQQKVDLNQADQKLLETLPGIGPTTARRILEYREENGRFERIEEIMNVWGIGEKKFERLKDLISVSPSVPDKPSSEPAKPTKEKPE